MRTMRGGFVTLLLAIIPYAGNANGQHQDSLAGMRAGSVLRDCASCPEMIVVPAGTFTMGSSPAEQKWATAHGATPASVADESPQHEMSIPSFAIGRYDVTRGEYATFVRQTGYSSGDGCGLDGRKWIQQPNLDWKNPGYVQTDREPVVCVSWHDAQAYVGWLNAQLRSSGTASSGVRYRLPSEAEWEYAARAGASTKFWWGDSADAAPDHAWFASNAGGRTHETGSKPSNAFGLFDMSGNVWQWTQDCYAESYAKAPHEGNAGESDTTCLRVDRGGSWSHPAWLLRSATRERNPASFRDIMLGFRVARSMQSPASSQHAAGAAEGHADTLGSQVRKYVRVSAREVILEHVEIIDGTGGPPRADENVRIAGGRIAAITPGADATPGDSVTVLDLRGYSVMPGIVGMHDHLAYIAQPNLAADNSFEPPNRWMEMSFSAPRLYLANGVTTLRTVGSIEPYTDIKLARAIEAGIIPGPHMDVTGPFLEGPNPLALSMPEVTGPEDARQTVAFWADRGVTSFKAYQDITRDELRAVVSEAHKRGLKVTGHLCSITYEEAAEIGIDNLEHGFLVNTALDPDKKADTCSASHGDYTLDHIGNAEANRLIRLLVNHHVAITSTLPLRAATVARESAANHGPMPRAAELEAMSPHARDAYFCWRNRPLPTDSKAAPRLRKDMDLERAFVAAGGLLIAGPDPVGFGGLVPGFADQRELELLVEAGFSPVEAIRIATLNGAVFLGRRARIGSIEVGKNADLVVMKGDPAKHIADIENVELVFKDGIGYDSRKLLDSVKGRYGEY